MRLRLQLAHAQKAVRKAEHKRPRPEKRICNHHVEIYADETGDLKDGIVSGLAICLYDDQEKADKLQKVWNSKKFGLCKGKDLRTDQNKCEEQVKSLKDFLNENDLAGDKRKLCKLWSVVATREPPYSYQNSYQNSTEVTLAAFPDGPLDNALRFNLEFTLYALIPYFSQEKFEGAIHIHLPTRQVPFTNKKSAEKLAEAFDLGEVTEVGDEEVKDNPLAKGLVGAGFKPSDSSTVYKVDTFSKGTAFPLVRGWLHDWDDRGSDIRKKIKKIKTTVLGGEHFHDIADWACTASKKHSPDEGATWVQPLRDKLTKKGIFSHWFISTDGKHAERGHPWYKYDTKNALVLMQALRASSQKNSKGQNNDMLRLLLRNTYIRDCEKRLLTSEFCSQQRLILWALRDELKNATGPSLHLLCV